MDSGVVERVMYMRKKRKLDFILHEEPGHQIIFRFYPKSSSCHSFNEEPPKSWDEVYKVYYNYAILEKYDYIHYLSEENEKEPCWICEKVFDGSFDECSIIDEVGSACLDLVKGITSWTVDDDTFEYLDNWFLPFGDGIKWRIHKFKRYLLNKQEEDAFEIEVFNQKNIGYRFTLDTDQLKEFGEYLIDCCNYMLQHGKSI